jgi:hypothetical protein
MSWLKKLIRSEKKEPVAESSAKHIDIDMPASGVSGIGMIYILPEPSDKEREFLQEQAQELYRQLNPEFAKALDAIGSRVDFVHGFTKTKEEATERAMRPGLHVVIQYRSMMLPGLSSKSFDLYAVTWFTKPTDGKPAVFITGDMKIIPEN